MQNPLSYKNISVTFISYIKSLHHYQTLQTRYVSMQFLTNSASLKGRQDSAISAATIKLAFTAASLCYVAFFFKT